MVTAQQMRDTMRLWASGVSVVTSANEHGRSGMTVSAFNSLSLEPPLILVCLSKEANTAHLVTETGCFGVSFLGEQHAQLSDRFAGRIEPPAGGDRFTGLNVLHAETGVPLLADAVAWLDCKVHQIHDGSTHWIVIGEVLATGQGATEMPLLYYNRKYRALAELT
ncbi:flavin reductase family protein [Anaerolineae bacterium CFX9]|jgi:flavin reductase (DIM6/NTAB) family NADH-FMN oxidoreductase RutF|nr:flavin reductase family protein [Anaerolineae bacterium CFX9]